MSGALLALWNDYPAAMAEEYEAWHAFEHVPERLTAPGMRAARRYVSSTSRESYFTLYELDDLTALEHPAYLDLVRNPTPWSRKMRRHFSQVLRIPGEIATTTGHGIGAAALVQAYSVERARARQALPALARGLHERMIGSVAIALRIAIAEPNQIYEVFAQDAVTDPDTFNVVAIVEGGSPAALTPSRGAVSSEIETLLQPRQCLRDDVFTLLMSYRADEFPAERSQIASSAFVRS